MGESEQAGVIAGAALYALEHHVERLADDHANAKLFAERIVASDAIRLPFGETETNIVFFEVEPAWGTAADLSRRLSEAGVRINAVGRQRLRAVTHLDATRDDVIAAADAVTAAVANRLAAAS